MLSLVADILIIALSTVAAMAGVYMAIQAYRKGHTTPRFLVGIIPETSTEGVSLRDIGASPSPGEDCRFNPRYFAVAVSREVRLSDVLRKEGSTRLVSADTHGSISLPILMQNQGKRLGGRYVLTIEFSDDRIQITGLSLGPMEQPVIVFTRHPDEFTSAPYREKVLPETLVERYAQLERVGACLVIGGALESSAYTIFCVQLKVPDNIEGFVVYYAIDCPDEFSEEKRFAQYVRTPWQGCHSSLGSV